jgi:cyanophycinase
MRRLAVLIALALNLTDVCAAPRIVLAGGGSEGEHGDTASWSHRLYRELIAGGDVTGDGRVTVAVLAASPQSEFIPEYFRRLGADRAANLTVASRDAAGAGATVAAVDAADAVFIKGGDQGKYYDLWNDTPLEAGLRRLVARGGGIGGTSAGAMALAEVALAGGKSLTAGDVLTDACTAMLDDEDGGSGLKLDFLGVVGGTTIDTHFTERGRLGRLLGVMARAATDHRRAQLCGIGLAERTGLVIEGAHARVMGEGAVTFVHATSASRVWRQPGRPLVYTHLTAHVLTDGWSFDLARRAVGTPPPGASPATSAATGESNAGALDAGGEDLERACAFRLAFDGAFAVVPSGARVHDAIGVADAHADARRERAHDGAVRALAGRPGLTALLMHRDSRVSRTSGEPDLLAFGPRAGVIVLDAHSAALRGDAAITPLTVHVLGASADAGWRYDTVRHRLAPAR